MENLDTEKNRQKRNDIYLYRFISFFLVFLFHLKIDLFSHYYIGVDFFFVISGYLLTSSFIRNAGEFSISNFYQKRINRIIPPLFGMIILTSTLSFIIFNDRVLQDQSDLLNYVSVFLQNNYFEKYTEYFSISSQLNPIIHTWSIAIEEQFYIIFPLLIFLSIKISKDKIRRNLVTAFGAILILSLSLSLYRYSNGLDIYYSLSSRLWQLSLGVLAALLPRNDIENIVKRFSIFFFLIILLAITVPINDSIFKSPTFNFILLLLFSLIIRNELIIKTAYTSISNLGKASYSLYLYHWPIIVYIYVLSSEWGALQILLSSLLTFIIAYISYLFTEHKTYPSKVSYSILASFIITTLALSKATFLYSDRIDDPSFSLVKCNFKSDHTCEIPSKESEQSEKDEETQEKGVLVLGDSQISHIENLVYEYQFSKNLTIYSNDGVCTFPEAILDPSNTECDSIRLSIDRMIREKKIQSIVAVSLWSSYRYLDNDRSSGSYLEKIKRYFEKFQRNNIKVIVIGEIPTFDFNLDQKLIQIENQSDKTSLKKSLGISLKKQEEKTKQSDHFFKNLDDISYITSNNLFCPKGFCHAFSANTLIYFDSNHLNGDGSDIYEAYIKNKLFNALNNAY
ncbi:MAG: acyltransferase [Oligoflexia bacterium]|nr:acyltransferase [Oligoflexia bacterium]